MKETLYKHIVKRYQTEYYNDFSDITDSVNSRKLINEEFFASRDMPVEVYTKNPKIFKNEKPVVFTHSKKTSTEESDFEKNYGNPLCSVNRRIVTIVVERENDKVSMKLFLSTTYRKVGQVYFRKSSHFEFVTFNKLNCFLYSGFIQNYHKKRKAIKKCRKNLFISSPINTFVRSARNYLDSSEHLNVCHNLITSFYNAAGIGSDLVLSHDDLFYKLYLDKMGIKYPNNFSTFRNLDYSLAVKLPELRKNEMKMVDTFMKKHSLNGKVLKKVLHTVKEIHFQSYKHALVLFGEDMMNNDLELTKACIEDSSSFWFSPQRGLKTFLSPQEVKNFFKMFRTIMIEKLYNLNTLFDHLRYYIELKGFGEPNIKWIYSDFDKDYHQQHLDWANTLSEYKNGTYFRIYPEKMEEMCCEVITTSYGNFYPVLLKDSAQYNEESQIQSNCVRTYVGTANAIIISLRKDSNISEERATIEYRLNKQSENKPIWALNVQERIRFNNKPTEEWTDAIAQLNTIVQSYVWSKNYENVKLKKICKNGVTLETESEWKEGGLFWIKNNEVNYYNNEF